MVAADNGAAVEGFDTDPGMAVVVNSETCEELRTEVVDGSQLMRVFAEVARCGHHRLSPVAVDRQKRQDGRQTNLLKLGPLVVDWTL